MKTTEHLVQFDLTRGAKPNPSTLASLPVVGAAAALSVTIPHAVGLGLVAFGPLSHLVSPSALALWSAAVPGALMTMLVRGPGVIYAPSTAVALLFGGMLALISQAGAGVGITAGQTLAITGVFASLGFLLQWVMANVGMARLARFIPVSVAKGFAAGVGLSLILGQFIELWGGGVAEWGGAWLSPVTITFSVVALSYAFQRVWPKFPSSLLAVALVTACVWLWLPSAGLKMAAVSGSFTLPMFPDWEGAPWAVVLEKYGFQLASLSLLMSVVNVLEVTVFHQQLESEYGIQRTFSKDLSREALIALCSALLGMIPASSSTSRSRTALSYTHSATLRSGQWHALGMIVVAVTGHLWLQHVPMAVLSGALVVAGLRMIPLDMLRPRHGTQRLISLAQSWVVGLVFVASSGAMALMAGLVVAMIELLRTSGSHAIRRMHLKGRLRSRHVRREQVELWLEPRMRSVAVFELQGIVSFGVAALVVDQVRWHMKDHRCVILDASRVPSWDETGCQRLLALGHELHEQRIAFVMSGVRGWAAKALSGLHLHEDLDRALEWAEEQILQGCPAELLQPDPPLSLLGDLGVEMEISARLALERLASLQTFSADQTILRQGESDRSMLFVQSGTVVLSTSPAPNSGMRLSVVGSGAVFGEMAFLNGIPRTAFAHAGKGGATVAALLWQDFQNWSKQNPEAAMAFITALARMGIRRLGATSQELRAAMD